MLKEAPQVRATTRRAITAPAAFTVVFALAFVFAFVLAFRRVPLRSLRPPLLPLPCTRIAVCVRQNKTEQ